MKNCRTSTRNKKRGTTLFEVVIGATIASMTLVAGVSLFFGSMMNWAKGAGMIDAMSSAQEAIRMVGMELREATSATIAADGLSVTYSVPVRNDDGSYRMPMTNDPTPRTLRLSSGRLELVVAGSTRIIASDVISTDPNTNSTYRVFTGDGALLTREIDVQVVCSKYGSGTSKEVLRARDSFLLRNVQQISR